MNFIVAIVGGIVGRMILTSLGATLISLNVPPETAAQIVSLVQSFGPTGGAVAGILVLGIAFVWSYWQKHRSGSLEPR